MRIFEAIMAGIKKSPLQEFGEWISRRDDNDEGDKSCVMGAMALGALTPEQFEGQALDEVDGDDLNEMLMDIYPKLKRRRRCPAKDCSQVAPAVNTMMHLNDDHKWSRERIAKWIDKPKQVENTVQAVITKGVGGELTLG